MTYKRGGVSVSVYQLDGFGKNGYCAWNNLLGDAVRLLGGEPGKGKILRGKEDKDAKDHD